jgi:hypothetical protein
MHFYEVSAKESTKVDEVFTSIAQGIVDLLKVNPEYYGHSARPSQPAPVEEVDDGANDPVYVPLTADDDDGANDPEMPSDSFDLRQTKLGEKCDVLIQQAEGLPAYLAWQQRRDAAHAALDTATYWGIEENAKAAAAVQQEAQQLTLTEADCATLPARRAQLTKDLTQLCRDLRTAEEFSSLVQAGKKLEAISALDLSGVVSDSGTYATPHKHHSIYLLAAVCICEQGRSSTSPSPITAAPCHCSAL